MTVTYLQHVQTSKIGGFLRLLLIWKGSVLKGIWTNLAIFLALWYFILIVYRFALVKNEDIKQTFERMCVFFDAHDTSIPLGFILGFYVSQIGKIFGSVRSSRSTFARLSSTKFSQGLSIFISLSGLSQV